MKIKIINNSKFKTKDLEEIGFSLISGQEAPDFYLICEDFASCNGITLTNLDKPTIIIFIKELGQFAKTFVHELTHLQQHAKGYACEKEAEDREIVITG